MRSIFRVPFGLPIFNKWLRDEEEELSVQTRFLDLVYDYDWLIRTLQARYAYTLNDFGKRFLWSSLLSLDIKATELDVSETDSFALLLASTSPNLISLRLFFGQMSAYPFGQIVQKCPQIETWELGISIFNYDAALDSLGKSTCNRPMNVHFHVDHMSEEAGYHTTLTSAGIEGFALSNIKLLSFAVFFENAYGDGIETRIRDFCDGIEKLKEIRHFSYLKCQFASAPHRARVVGSCKSLLIFKSTHRYSPLCKLIMQDMLRFTVVDDYIEETYSVDYIDIEAVEDGKEDEDDDSIYEDGDDIDDDDDDDDNDNDDDDDDDDIFSVDDDDGVEDGG
jgi:hypothetical protein